jgi:hypothetical protein
MGPMGHLGPMGLASAALLSQYHAAHKSHLSHKSHLRLTGQPLIYPSGFTRPFAGALFRPFAVSFSPPGRRLNTG